MKGGIDGRALTLLVVFYALGGASACSTTSSRIKARFAREQSCPQDRVAVSDEGGMVYRASGCDQSTEYVCGAFAGMGDSSRECRARGLNPHEPTGNPPPQNDSRPDLVAPK
jgi:hypothetical protein